MKKLTFAIFLLALIACKKEDSDPIVVNPPEKTKTAFITITFDRNPANVCLDNTGDSMYFKYIYDGDEYIYQGTVFGTPADNEYTFEIQDDDPMKLWSVYFYSTCGYGVQITIESEGATLDNYGIWVSGSHIFSFYIKSKRIDVL